MTLKFILEIALLIAKIENWGRDGDSSYGYFKEYETFKNTNFHDTIIMRPITFS